ncbi:MAG TPA: RNA 2',3'-cyclic phosphodiesterase [Streptosporangiaceae bacterium]|nr:RNA 2',3'-cyclic phosphodiesterase [Streptosporangiaceae bacterium]
MRLFVAVQPPPAILDELEELVSPYRDAWPQLKWVGRDFLHITLAFFGEVDENALDGLLVRLERVASRYSRLELSFAGAGAFPGRGTHARVVWTGLYGDRRALSRMSASVCAAGRRAGTAEGEHKPFRPHLTLARCRRPTDVRPLIEELAAYAGTHWTADAIHLVRSHLGADMRYETVKSWTLKD